jgi:hypothetical protein
MGFLLQMPPWRHKGALSPSASAVWPVQACSPREPTLSPFCFRPFRPIAPLPHLPCTPKGAQPPASRCGGGGWRHVMPPPLITPFGTISPCHPAAAPLPMAAIPKARRGRQCTQCCSPPPPLTGEYCPPTRRSMRLQPRLGWRPPTRYRTASGPPRPPPLRSSSCGSACSRTRERWRQQVR